MKVFIVARGWPSEREPQWGNFERDQALALRNLGHEVVYLSVDVRFRSYHRKYGITRTEHDDIHIYNFFAGSLWGKALRRISVNLQDKIKKYFFLYLLKQVVKQEGIPDIIYGHYLSVISMAIAAKKRYGVPVVGIEHWSELGFENIKKYVKYLAEKTYSELDALLTVSHALHDNILKNFGVDSIVVSNMVGKEFQYQPREKKNGVIRFVSTGNLLPVKGYDNLIAAFERLHLPTSTWSLDIIGDGKEHNHLKEMIQRANLCQNIRLVGRKDRKGVIEVLHNSDVYVMSSRSETFGVAAIEALACGVPVIATECGGAKDFITQGNGVTCSVNDVERLADSIAFMVEHYQQYNHEEIAKDCQSRFSSEAVGKQLEKIFNDIIDKKR